jgi:hypothetical protein
MEKTISRRTLLTARPRSQNDTPVSILDNDELTLLRPVTQLFVHRHVVNEIGSLDRPPLSMIVNKLTAEAEIIFYATP